MVTKTEAKPVFAYAGADWVERTFKVKCSDLGRKVADLLGEVFKGIYHLDDRSLRKVLWNDIWNIRVVVSNSLSTYDSSELTHLVILCHDLCVRLEIAGRAPGFLELSFGHRTREGSSIESHPTIEWQIKRFCGILYPEGAQNAAV